MTVFLPLWLVLVAVYGIVSTVTLFALFRHLDLAFDHIVALLSVPAFQAAVLTVAGGKRIFPLATIVRETWCHPLVRVVLLMDAVLLPVGWILAPHPRFGIEATSGVPTAWLGTKAVAAACFLVAEALSLVGRRAGLARDAATRGLILACAALLLATGLHLFHPWLQRLPALLVPVLLLQGRMVFAWAVVYGGGSLIGLQLVAFTARRLRSWSMTRSCLFEFAGAIGFVAFLVASISVILRPFLTEPWRGLAISCLSVAATLLLASALMAVDEPPSEKTPDAAVPQSHPCA